ncbi:MAG TPA: metallopeptidase TldD-related protein, partial [Methanocella sp.]|nr:metallopeptidase TldD-related protein [Methanocella sp.]
RSTEKAIGQLGQKAVESGAMDVVLRPDAAFQILAATVVPSFYGDAVRRGESMYAGKVGQEVAAPGVTVVDDATHPRGLNTYVSDEEGCPSRRNVLVDRGVLAGFLYDEFSAAEARVRPTGNAMRAERMESVSTYKTAPQTCARNIILEGETVDAEEMIRGIRDGIVVDNVLGAHTANRASGDFSVAIYAGHAIRDGAIAFPLKGGMIGGNMPALLMRAALADNHRLVEAGLWPTTGYVPSVKFEDVRVSGE